MTRLNVMECSFVTGVFCLLMLCCVVWLFTVRSKIQVMSLYKNLLTVQDSFRSSPSAGICQGHMKSMGHICDVKFMFLSTVPTLLVAMQV